MQTNVQSQYAVIKNSIPNDYMLFFQLGEFYELFHEDAIKAHHAIGITLTKRGTIPMAGVPLKSAIFYAKKLVFEHNYTIAICDQVHTTTNNKIIERKITKILNKGTLYDEMSNDYTFVCSIVNYENTAYIVYGDRSTHEFYITNTQTDDVLHLIKRINATYIICNDNKHSFINEIINTNIQYTSELILNDYEQTAFNNLMFFFEKSGFKINPIITRNNHKNMYIHANTMCNLEVFADIKNNKNNSLFAIINRTQTSMGHRFLYKRLLFPLTNDVELNTIYDLTEKYIHFIKNKNTLIFNIGDLSRYLKNIHGLKDLERILLSIRNAKKLLIICEKHQLLPAHLMYLYAECIQINIDDYINNNIHDDFKHIHKIIELNKQIEVYQTQMYEFVKNLNINATLEHNSILNTFFVTRKIHNNEEFIPLKHMKGAYRYTHNFLLQCDKQIQNLNDNIHEIKQNIINDCIEYIHKHTNIILKLCHLIEYIDYIYSNAIISIEYNLTRPTFDNVINITNGFHLFLYKNQICIQNDLHLQQNILLTGANMGGKSTYLRQNAIIVLMAQSGLFVPAQKATLKIIHELFVRMGANDNIFENESTFFIEMKECAMFLNNITENSLIILDEIGRGTSYKEGMAISIALCNYIYEKKAMCIVSTHYLELYTHIPQYKCQYMNYITHNDQITFLYKVVNGHATSSLSLYTARLAGINSIICENAMKIINFI